jgi:hypothetical protein
MAVALGKDVVSEYTGIANEDIRNVTITDETETADTTARGSNGWKEYAKTFTTKTVEIDCLAHALAVGEEVGDLAVVSIAVNEPLDDVVSYTITLKPQEPETP